MVGRKESDEPTALVIMITRTADLIQSGGFHRSSLGPPCRKDLERALESLIDTFQMSSSCRRKCPIAWC